MIESTFEERDLVWFDFRGKRRHAVVLLLDPERGAIIAHGTSRARDFPCVCVEDRSRDARALALSCTTYFYESGVCAASFDELKRWGRKCPPELFLRLKEFAGLNL